MNVSLTGRQLACHGTRETAVWSFTTAGSYVHFSSAFFLWRCDPTRVMASSFLRFLHRTQRRITVGRTPLDEWSARRRDLYLTTYNTHNRQTTILRVGFEPTISAGERPQTYALDRVASGTGNSQKYNRLNVTCRPKERKEIWLVESQCIHIRG